VEVIWVDCERREMGYVIATRRRRCGSNEISEFPASPRNDIWIAMRL